MKSFWQTIKKPIIGLAPMDGITDPAFRAVVDEIGHPSVLYTEFISAEGLCRNTKRLLQTFTSHNTHTPLVGQLFGADPVAMQEAAALLIEKTTIAGIDINMGCPDRSVVHKGAGASLITHPNLAKRLIEAVRTAIRVSKKNIGISVKTRIGFDVIDTHRWVTALLETHLDAISIHGRTYKQVFTGPVYWEELKKAAIMSKNTSTILLGNGDIKTYVNALEKINAYTPDGVLIGRATFGNPWVFRAYTPSRQEVVDAARLHCTRFKELTPHANPLSLRKHLAWYTKGFPDASLIRKRIMKMETAKEALDFFSSLSYSE